MSLVDTVKNAFVPVHKEGYPFIGAFAMMALRRSPAAVRLAGGRR